MKSSSIVLGAAAVATWAFWCTESSRLQEAALAGLRGHSDKDGKLHESHIAAAAMVPAGVADEAAEHPSISDNKGAMENTSVYRPFAKRFDLTPSNKSNDAFKMPENRRAYREYTFTHPRHALATTSTERNAEANALCVFIIAAMSLVMGGLFAWDRMAGVPPEKQIPGILAVLAVPWLITTSWILQVVLIHGGHPTRGGGVYSDEMFQCEALIWYLLFLPFTAALVGVTQVLSLSHMVVLEDTGTDAPMGRMFDSTFASSERTVEKMQARIVRMLMLPGVRQSLLVFGCALLLFGVLVVFFGGDGRKSCAADVWWTSVILADGTLLILVFAALSALCCYAVLQISKSPWLQDFVNSFQRKPRSQPVDANGAAVNESPAIVQQLGVPKND